MVLAIFHLTLFFGLAIGGPFAFALMVCAAVLMTWMGLFNPQIISQQMVTGANSFTLLAIPFLLLAGELMNAGGLSKRIVAFAIDCVGHIRGGLGIVAVIAAVVMASLSGSAAADSAALAAILIPVMREAGYNVPRSAGLMAASGVIDPVYFGTIFVMTTCEGLLTPPVGVVLNVVSGVARVSLGKVIWGALPFLAAQLGVLLRLIAFPKIVTVPLAILR